MTRQRYLIDAYGPDEHATELALRTCEFLAQETGNGFVMIVDCIFSTSENKSLPRLFGKGAFAELIANGSGKYKQTPVSIVEVHAIPPKTEVLVALLPFCHEATLATIEERTDVLAIVAFPWRDGDTDQWERTFNPNLVKRSVPLTQRYR